MADKTREDYLREVEENAVKAAEEARADREKAAEEADAWAEENGLVAQASGVLKGDEAEEHRRAVGRTMIFGDIDTTAGASAGGTDVPTTDNETATVDVAEKDVQASLGDEDAEEVGDQQARRQGAVEAGITESAEEADTGAEAREENEGEGDVAPADVEGGHGAQTRAADKVRAIQEAETVEEVDELLDGDERSTVVHAAEKRKEQLSC
jgi:hypothetical protein